MNYPDGQLIRIGDLIWWGEGSCVGHVQVIAETPLEFEAWGLKIPHVFISNIHPFDSTIRSGIVYDEAGLEDEAIGLLDPKEIELFEAAVKAAATMSVNDLDSHHLSVTTECLNGRRVAWIFDVRSGDLVIEQVRVPC